MRATAIMILLMGTCSIYGCSNFKAIPRYHSLKTRASFDLNCLQERLKLQQLGDMDVMGVSGCDKRATYVKIDYTWYSDNPANLAAKKSLDERREKEEEEKRKKEEEEE